MNRISIRHRSESVCPSIVHANGVAKTRMWDFIKKQFFLTTGQFSPVSDHAQQQDWTKKLTVLTWNTSGKQGTFEQSCRVLGVPAYAIKGNVKQPNNRTRITYPVKVGLTCDVLKEIKTEFVMLVDSYDALLLDSPARVLDCFLHNFEHNDVVFGAEKGCFPPAVKTKVEEGYVKLGIDRPYLNSGFCIGRTKDVANIYSKAKEVGDSWDYDKNGILTDQGAIKSVDDDRVQIDTLSRMCLNLYGTNPGELEILYVNNGIRLETV